MTITEETPLEISLLYVEDEVGSQEMLSEIIRHHYPDVRLYVASNGEEGLSCYKKFLPDIIITDINMPITNGLTMAAQIKALSPSTEIIALTAYTDTRHLLQAIEVGVSNYILKPINVEQIFNVIDKTLAIIRSERLIVRQNNMIRDLNSELAHKAAELELVNQDLKSFNYTVAHDLRSPMVTISGFSRKLLEKHAAALDDTGNEYLRIIDHEIHRMSSLVGALLNFSVHSQKQVGKKWTCFSSIAQEISDNLLTQHPERHVTFQIGKGIKGYGDPDLMRLVFENLFGNAWKYSAHTNHCRIELGTINKEEDLIYFVRDNGSGFDQQEAEKLFAPFQRLTCDHDVEGWGIGLATVQRIIQRHGGRIWAEGEKGKGATFYFTL